MAAHADAGRPIHRNGVATSKIQRYDFHAYTRQLSMRNTGGETLWVSLDEGETWFDVSSGTSYDERVNIDSFLVCTQTGMTSFVAVGVELKFGQAIHPGTNGHVVQSVRR